MHVHTCIYIGRIVPQNMLSELNSSFMHYNTVHGIWSKFKNL